MATTPDDLRYPKPRILLIDIPDAVYDALRDAGYNVHKGTFGRPDAVTPSGQLSPVPVDTQSLPHISEQDIVIANLVYQRQPSTTQTARPGERLVSIWQRATSGLIDPRPYSIAQAYDSFARIFRNGGLFIIQLDGCTSVTYERCYIDGRRVRPDGPKNERTDSTWKILPDLGRLKGEMIHGTEIYPVDHSADIAQILSPVLSECSYEHTLYPDGLTQSYFTCLFKNKFDHCVGGLFENPRGSKLGHALLLPQIGRLDEVVVPLIERWAARVAPSLFPSHEIAEWIHHPDYEIPDVLEVDNRIAAVRERAESEIDALDEHRRRLQEEKRHWYQLLTSTGDDLVEAVIHALSDMGFENIVDMDKEAAQEGTGRTRREDLQVRDGTPTLVIDVKGVHGKPSDDEAQQAEKHALMRIRETGDTQYQPLTIINYERHLPPKMRDSKPYRDEIVGNAEMTGLGLMTTCDLYCLLRNQEKLGWTKEIVTPIFYRTGRIEPVPAHYRLIGTIVAAWDHSFGINPNESLKIGETIAIEITDGFVEIEIPSIQVDDSVCDECSEGSNCGIGIGKESVDLREGVRVFRVLPSDS